ncbi:hypothetical protein F4782DRAFT_486912 [Xylaria castorea]|nr:hypothetical protein F4782DRAFT_486912 [Xylaria castorea]
MRQEFRLCSAKLMRRGGTQGIGVTPRVSLAAYTLVHVLAHSLTRLFTVRPAGSFADLLACWFAASVVLCSAHASHVWLRATRPFVSPICHSRGSVG